MAVNATAAFRVRPSGSNTNGGGYDTAISSAATGTNGSLSGVTFTDTVAAAFTAGMVGASINITGVGQYLIASRISATQITLTVGTGGTLPQLGGGASWTVGGGTDYSQQNSAQASGTNGTAAQNSTTFTDSTANAFTSAMVGNAIWIASGTNFVVNAYFVTAFTSASTVTLDRAPATAGAGSAGAWKLGGGWADFWTNTTSSGPLVAGNIVYVLGSGTPNPASYTYDYTVGTVSLQSGSATAGFVTFANDPGTPGYKVPPDTTGGMPVIKATAQVFLNLNYAFFAGLYFVADAASANGILSNANHCTVFGTVLDQFSFDCALSGAQANYNIIGCEVFSSVAPGSNGSNPAIAPNPSNIVGCNIHDTVGPAILLENGLIERNIIAKCRGYGIYSDLASVKVIGNTIDANIGNAIQIHSQTALLLADIRNNIISNHTTVSTFGLTIDAGTAAQNSAYIGFADYNVFYNNTSNYNAINAGPHDTALSSDPYNGQSTEDYSLA